MNQDKLHSDALPFVLELDAARTHEVQCLALIRPLPLQSSSQSCPVLAIIGLSRLGPGAV